MGGQVRRAMNSVNYSCSALKTRPNSPFVTGKAIVSAASMSQLTNIYMNNARFVSVRVLLVCILTALHRRKAFSATPCV